MRHLANLISLSRIVLVLLLLLVYHDRFWFVFLYLLAGFTDLLDGYVARQTHTQTALGARLDSTADLILFGVVLIVMILWLREQVLVFLPWIIFVALIRISNLIIAARKYGAFAILHTWANKLTGMLLFLTPLLFVIYRQMALLRLVCMMATLSAVEEGIIHLVTDELDLSRRSLFLR